MGALQEAFTREEMELQSRIAAQRQRETMLNDERTRLTRLRRADVETVTANRNPTKKSKRPEARL